MVKNPTKTTYLYVDASNLYGAISDVLANGTYIDFSEILACVGEDFIIHKVKAYGTFLADEPHSSLNRRKFIGAQHKFFQSIIDNHKVEFQKGYFSNTSKKEKGIDVRLAVDMLKDAYEGSCKCEIIMTGDDDFIYSIKCVRNINIPVHMASLGSRFPFGIAHNTNTRVVYDLYSYFKNTILPKINRPPANLKVRDITDKVNILSV